MLKNKNKKKFIINYFFTLKKYTSFILSSLIINNIFKNCELINYINELFNAILYLKITLQKLIFIQKYKIM